MNVTSIKLPRFFGYVQVARFLPAIAMIFWLGTHPVRANNAGGFVTTTTTSVTTGTEAYSTRTDHFLDNGILRVLISDKGSVDSIKYLPPGSSGTPKSNGTEMVSQSGVNYGNHTNIYYYWYPDSNGVGSYLGTSTVGTYKDLACKHTYNPATDKVPIDMEIHYVLGKGNTGLYVYMVAHHPASYASYGDASISFIQMIWPGPHDANNYLLENQYLDDTVKYGLSINGVQQTRNGPQPTLYDDVHAAAFPGYPKEIVQYTTGTFAGQLNGKYSYNFDYPTIGTWGRASDTKHLGLWFVAGNHDYQSNGPTAAEYAGGYTGLLLFEPLIAHYGNTGLTINATQEWTKVYGPWLLYFNNKTTGVLAWQDSRNQVTAESQAWPYSWLVNSNYQPKAQRATVTGKLVINDALRAGSSAAGAWVGLAAPDSGVENASDNWQFQSDGYQYWVQADANGNFTIPNVQTLAPDGGTASFKLYAYTSGTSPATGSVGEFSAGPVAITSGSTTNLGTLTWNVPHSGNQIVWEIGIPNRSAIEFRHGNEYGKPGLWSNFINEFTNPLEYNIGDDWSTGLNYCHSVDNMATSPWKWHLNFNLTSVNQGTYWLNIAYASAASIQIIRVNDESTAFATYAPANNNQGNSLFLRQGIHAKYTVAHVAIPWNKLRVGTNTITLDHEVHTDHGTAHFMYDYINLEAPALVVLPPGRDLVWKGGVSSNTWDNTVTNWLVSGSAAPTVAYVDGDRPLFDDTGSNNPSITLSGTLKPGRIILSNSTKNYTFAGTGTLIGPMQLLKSGAGTLTVSPPVSPVQVVVTGTLTSGTSTVTTPTAGLAVGMLVGGTGIPASTSVTSISGSSSLTLSQNATTTGTSSLTFSAVYTFSGGSDISGGTVVFNNDTANSYGLGTGPITLEGATLQMYDNYGTYNSSYWDLNVPSGSISTLKADSRVDLYGSLNGGGTLDLYVPYVRTTIYGNWSGFTGQINVTTDSNGGDFRVANTNGYPNSAINLGPKVNCYSPLNSPGTYPIGKLSGDPSSQLSGIVRDNGTPGSYTLTWLVGGLSTDATFSGSISNGSSPSITAITKTGYGTWTIAGPCSYTGPTNVLAGILRFTGTGIGSTNLTVGLNGSLELAGGLLTINGAATNYGTVRLTGSGSLQTTGTFTNYGVFDTINGSGGLPSNFVNQGVVIDSSVVQVQSISKSGSATQLTIQSYSGHNYQLQRNTVLTSGTWTNIGAAQAGNDDVLTFTDATSPAAKAFYRISVTP